MFVLVQGKAHNPSSKPSENHSFNWKETEEVKPNYGICAHIVSAVSTFFVQQTKVLPMKSYPGDGPQDGPKRCIVNLGCPAERSILVYPKESIETLEYGQSQKIYSCLVIKSTTGMSKHRFEYPETSKIIGLARSIHVGG